MTGADGTVPDSEPTNSIITGFQVSFRCKVRLNRTETDCPFQLH
jgi:hypothetical protein